MESFLNSYHLEFTVMQELLIHTGSLVAGSAALALYLEQEGMEPGFEPANLNIFLEADDDDRIATYLSEAGYVEVEDPTVYQNIQRVQFFVHSAQEREIHLIYCGGEPLQYIQHDFDLSCCCTWWNAAVDQFVTVHPELTKQKRMFYKDHRVAHAYENGRCTEVHVARLALYQARGFTITERLIFPIGLEGNDLRELVYLAQPNKLSGQVAFDTWEYEDVDCVTYLRSSPYHILVYAGEKYYAFHRDNLHEYMKEHFRRVNPVGTMYTMPFGQSVTEHAMCMFLYDDYSVYEVENVCSAMSAEYHPVLVSLCRVKCYTVYEWDVGVAGLVVEPMD